MIALNSILYEIEIPLTLDTQVARFSQEAYAGSVIEMWVFDSFERRQAAQKQLAQTDVTARIRCAYKPLLHAFLEEIDLEGAREIIITYPTVKDVAEDRFLLECYPVADLIGGVPVRFNRGARVDGSALFFYRVEVRGIAPNTRVYDVAAPNGFSTRRGGEHVLSNQGWLRVTSLHTPALSITEPLETEMETAFQGILSVFDKIPMEGSGPFFDRADIRVEAPFFDHPLPAGTECISTSEAMHEDIYFSVLELLNIRRGKDATDRTFEPGQLVPVTVPNMAAARVRIEITDDPELAKDAGSGTTTKPVSRNDLEVAEKWLEPKAIKAHLDILGGESFTAQSRRGRPVWGQFIEGSGPGVVISAGQHSNETSGVIGALRAAYALRDNGSTRFAVSPLNNPDGYALFRELSETQPHHMHHAARYTASGSDLEYTGPKLEHEIRLIAKQKTQTDLHLNLHGYPAHEWTRPFSGYVPYGFDTWSIPKGFCLILRVTREQRALGEAILDAAVDALARDEDVMALNTEQLARYSTYVPVRDFEIRRNVPVFIAEVADDVFSITIITEAPDETIYGEAFITAHRAQMKVVLAATETYQTHLAGSLL